MAQHRTSTVDCTVIVESIYTVLCGGLFATVHEKKGQEQGPV